MTVLIQIRNVPDALHKKVKARAALAGMSLSDYLLQSIREQADLPTPEEIQARLARHPKLDLDYAPTDAVRAERDNDRL